MMGGIRNLLRGVALHQSRKDNTLLLTKNQIRLLEAQGTSMEEICQIMEIARATYFRLKAGTDAPGDE